MQTLPQGGNAAVPVRTAHVRIGWAPERIGGLDVDASAYLLKADGHVRSDDDMIFYNQPTSTDGAVTLDNGVFVIDLDLVPAEIERIAFAVTMHDAEGKGISFAQAQKAFFEIDGVARFDAPTAGMIETALIIGELYRRNGQWKIRAVGQGFAGGLAPLARHFGIVVEEHAPSTPAHAPAARVSLEKRLVSLEKKDPQLVSLVKKVQVSLEKRQLKTDKAKVALVLDISGSMDGLYRSRKIDHLVQRIMALGFRFDDDEEIDVFLFGTQAHSYGPLTVDNYRDFVPTMSRTYPLEPGTYYGKVMGLVRQHYKSQKDWGKQPVYVMFVTDGGTQDVRVSETSIREASAEPIFWSFMAIGPKPTGGLFGTKKSTRLPRGFDFLAYLDDMPGRVVDNANFFSVTHPAEPTDEELFDLLMEEYPRWLAEVSSKGILRP
ncbi:VWA domain-containing protein [Insolitispirillum peregrinum]|uniref:VWA domain-containing protein n=1 Tax=Insolitispirillum peregrinum TaxID=80876 RepID=UPI00361AAF94